MTIGRMMALALAVASPVVLAGAAQAQQAQTTGRNVTSVTIDAGPNGQYVMEGARQWAELNSRGRPVFHFRETGRDDWSVYLADSGRGIELQLDLHRHKVLISERGGPRRDLYNIVRFSSDGRYAPPAPRPTPSPSPRGGWNDGRAVEVGPIWNQRDAEAKCAAKARELRGEWTGQWWTTVQGRMSVCEIRSGGGFGGRDDYRGDRWDNDRDGDRGGDRDWDRDDDWRRDGTRDVEVGPIWSQRDAETKCRAKADEIRAEWTGNWSTTVPGRMSVCAMRRGGGGDRRDVTRQIEVGPIWNQSDAQGKCTAKARELRAEWTGQWRTTVQGRMSECELRFR